MRRSVLVHWRPSQSCREPDLTRTRDFGLTPDRSARLFRNLGASLVHRRRSSKKLGAQIVERLPRTGHTEPAFGAPAVSDTARLRQAPVGGSRRSVPESSDM